MTLPHVSNLVLDEISAGLPVLPELAAHLDACADCRRRSESIRAQRGAAMASPQFERVWSRIPRPARRRSSRKAWAIPMVFSLAAAGFVFVVSSVDSTGGDREKGAFALKIVRASPAGRVTDGPFGSGENVSLEVNSVGHRYALVIGVDAEGAVQRVWPPDTLSSGVVPERPYRPLVPGFEVTPGGLALYAFFSDEPLSVRTVLDSTKKSLADAYRHGQDLRSFQPPVMPSERGRASAVLDVVSP
jgi:hypothetical protein